MWNLKPRTIINSFDHQTPGKRHVITLEFVSQKHPMDSSKIKSTSKKNGINSFVTDYNKSIYPGRRVILSCPDKILSSFPKIH